MVINIIVQIFGVSILIHINVMYFIVEKGILIVTISCLLVKLFINKQLSTRKRSMSYFLFLIEF